jgi:hypothetical protein
MNYFSEIENWQKYFGCISIGKQGSNASTTSLYSMPLLQYHGPTSASAVLKLKDRKIRAIFLPKNITKLIKPMDQGIIQAFKAHSHGKPPGDVNSELQITEFLRILTLKGVGLAQWKVIPSSITNCLEDNVTEDKCNFISKTRCEGCM